MTSWLLQPAASDALTRWHAGLSPRKRRWFVIASISFACIGVATFIVHFGRQQYGGWDYNILVDVGWRQLIGQRPYVDFVTPTPPLFNWTAVLAFRLFGVNWNANLYLAALFSAGTLVWSFLLLRRLGLRTFAALGTACAMQTAAMLTCCFWWYNNTTLILAALFYLSSLALARSSTSHLLQISYVLLLGVLPLAKPNVAGVTVLGCVVLLLLASRRRGLILVLTVAGALLSFLMFLALHIPVGAMLATYRGIAKERGGLSMFGFRQLEPGEQWMTVLWFCALCLPMLCLWPLFRQNFVTHRWRQVAYWMFFPLAALIGAYGVAGNGELRDVEFTLLLGALAMLAFVHRREGRLTPRFTVALICAMMATDLYTGAARLRVYTIRPHVFFEWKDHEHGVNSGFLKGMRISETLVEVEREIHGAVQDSPGPVFFGPRLDYAYAAQGLRSPMHWASFFQPGTAFDRAEVTELVQAWRKNRFQTLVFLKGDYTFYPDALFMEIDTNYIRDDRYPRITVYHRRPGM